MVADPAVVLLSQSLLFPHPRDLLLARSKLHPCSVTVFNVDEQARLEKVENLVMPVTTTYKEAREKDRR